MRRRRTKANKALVDSREKRREDGEGIVPDC